MTHVTDQSDQNQRIVQWVESQMGGRVLEIERQPRWGDRTFKLGSGTTSGYGRYVKSL